MSACKNCTEHWATGPDNLCDLCRDAGSSFAPAKGSGAMEAKVQALELRIAKLEKHSHPAVNLRPAVEAIVEEVLSRQNNDYANQKPAKS